MMRLILLLLLLIPSLVLAQGGKDKLLINENGNVIVGTTSATGEFQVIHNGVVVLTTEGGGVSLGLPDGSATNPALYFEDDQNTGVYRTATADVLRIAAGGLQVANFGTDTMSMRPGGSTVATFDSGGLEMATGSVIQNRPGSSSNPAYQFGTDTNTGMYQNGSDRLGFAAGGAFAGEFYSGGLRTVIGSASAPSIQFSGDTNSGFYWISADTIGVSTGGSLTSFFDTGGLTTAGEIRNTSSGGALILRSPDGSYSVCTVDNSDNFTCTAE